jgi:hypothetical protein
MRLLGIAMLRASGVLSSATVVTTLPSKLKANLTYHSHSFTFHAGSTHQDGRVWAPKSACCRCHKQTNVLPIILRTLACRICPSRWLRMGTKICLLQLS